jgi:hypothetical protein
MSDYPWVKWARLALDAEIRQEPLRVKWALETIAKVYPNDTPEIMLAWIDTGVAALGLDPAELAANPPAVAFHAIETGSIEHADEVPASVAAAGRLIAARLANDEAQFVAVLASVPEGRELGLVFVRVLTAVARWIRDGSFVPRP